MFNFFKLLFKDFYIFSAAYSNNSFPDPLSKEEEEIISQYYEAVRQKEAMTKELERLTKEKNDLAEALEDYEISVKKENSTYSKKI